MKTFKSFFMGGYECADHINRSGERVNLLVETEHDIRIVDDYRDLAAIGIKVVREGICWSAVEEQPGIFDFTEVLNRMAAAEKFGIQQIWDLIHFGYPDGLYPTHPKFCERFKNLCEAFATFHKEHSKQQLFVVPINEISFLSWHSGEVRGTVPFGVNCGWDIKYHLCKAAIIGIQALKNIDPECRIILVEPLIQIHTRNEEHFGHVEELNGHQFQAMDIIAGKICPELGGDLSLLDILGFNYYWNSQWEHGATTLDWPDVLNQRHALSRMLTNAYQRYGRPMFLSETGHFGSGRVEWLEEIIVECQEAIANGVQLLGVCIYPVIDRPDWDDLSSYSDCGIWDFDAVKNRIPHESYINAIREGQLLFEEEVVLPQNPTHSNGNAWTGLHFLNKKAIKPNSFLVK